MSIQIFKISYFSLTFKLNLKFEVEASAVKNMVWRGGYREMFDGGKTE